MKSDLTIRIDSDVDISNHPIFPMLLMSMSKWKQLRIQVPHETLYSLSLYVRFLVSLSTLIIDDTPRGTDNLSRPIDTFHLASSLKRVEANLRVTTHLQLPWKQLTHLSSWGTYNGQSLEILKRVQGVDASIKNLSFVFHNSKIPPISFDGSGPVLLQRSPLFQQEKMPPHPHSSPIFSRT
ncbi:hypothetical protein ARMGADRAFT_612965 [Armillaria gallica]|uniref:Uncharacterized protein n=1 Tax=Armillaria gallica TaxID=47427 RepID=A0A2H3D792_ARMGA|nr:hypothetical protein ARMGADRAFT_612965 [Armillaria gallica]